MFRVGDIIYYDADRVRGRRFSVTSVDECKDYFTYVEIEPVNRDEYFCVGFSSSGTTSSPWKLAEPADPMEKMKKYMKRVENRHRKNASRSL